MYKGTKTKQMIPIMILSLITALIFLKVSVNSLNESRNQLNKVRNEQG